MRRGFRFKGIVSVLAFLLVAGCANTGAEDISSGTLAGTINGEAWSFVAGWGDPGDSDVLVSLFSGAATACGFEDGSETHVLIAVPLTPGTYPFGLDKGQVATMVYSMTDGTPMNVVATTGTLVVHEVTAEKVTAGVVMVDGDHEVNGQFEVTLCP